MNLTDYNEIRALLARHKFRFSKSMGQNFLTAAWVPQDIAESAELSEEDLELLSRMYLRDGQCLADITLSLPAGCSWYESVDTSVRYDYETLKKEQGTDTPMVSTMNR